MEISLLAYKSHKDVLTCKLQFSKRKIFFILHVTDSSLYATLVYTRPSIVNEFYFPGNIKINWVNESSSIQIRERLGNFLPSVLSVCTI